MVDAVLRIENLTKNFGGLRVTDEVTLDVRPGELHAVIGPNGAGKTTLINQISGLLAPDAFLGPAEQSGLIIPLGELVLEAACQHIVTLEETLDRRLHVAVNVSAAQGPTTRDLMQRCRAA